MQNLAGAEGCFFDMEHSGSILAWHYFHGVQTPAPKLLTLIEDRDLWRWQYRELSEPLYYGLRKRCSNSNFKTYVPYLDVVKLQELIEEGKGLVASNKLWCQQEALLAQAKTFKLPDSQQHYAIMCREVLNDNLVSELSEYLYREVNPHADFVMLWSKTADGKYRLNFRSNKAHIDVSAIAFKLGGGGHKQAAGAVIEKSPLELLQ
jgi:oligoribonuclease NrnB/cAMP/cGMP phosphodiesterase (DHH superfamily)